MCSTITLKGKCKIIAEAITFRKNSLSFKGGDSFGCVYHIYNLGSTTELGIIKEIDIDTFMQKINDKLKENTSSIVTVTLFSRSTPETENEVTINTVINRTQPIKFENIAYAHHGIITNPELKSDLPFEIDSEVMANDLSKLMYFQKDVQEFDEKYSDSSIALTGFVTKEDNTTDIFAYNNYLGIWYRDFGNYVEITNVPHTDKNYLSVDNGLTIFPKTFGLVNFSNERNPMEFIKLSSSDDITSILTSLESFSSEEFPFKNCINVKEV